MRKPPRGRGLVSRLARLLPLRLGKASDGKGRFLLIGAALCVVLYALLCYHAAAATATATAAAIPAGARVHGFVTKVGPLDPQQWQVAHKEWRQNRTQAWLAQREEAVAAGCPLPPLQLFSACQVLVNHVYKVVYLRHAKTASSSLLCHFKGCRRSGEGTANATASVNNQTDATLSFEPLQMLTGQELEDLWSTYFVLTFVRNSYQRAVSSYRMMMRNLSPPGNAAYGGWNQFCADPAGFASVCTTDRLCSKKGADFVWDHINAQEDCMLAAGGGWAVDFIGRTEAIDEDLATVLDELERRRPSDAPPVRPLEKQLENVNGRGCNESSPGNTRPAAREQYCDVMDYYRGQHSACFPAIQQQYGHDVEGLQFGPAPTGEQRQQQQQQQQQQEAALGRRAAAGGGGGGATDDSAVAAAASKR